MNVLTYIRERKKELKGKKHKDTLREQPKRREMISQRYKGRLRELERLEHLILEGKVK
jgi:hypothetical protein